MRRPGVPERVRGSRRCGIRCLAYEKKGAGQMMKIRQCLPDDVRLGQRRMRHRHHQVTNLQLPVFAEMPGHRGGRTGAGCIVPMAFAGGGILMTGTGKNEDFFMARAHGNHPRSAYDDEQKGKQHDAGAQCSDHGMPQILERRREGVKSKSGGCLNPEGKTVIFPPLCGADPQCVQRLRRGHQ